MSSLQVLLIIVRIVSATHPCGHLYHKPNNALEVSFGRSDGRPDSGEFEYMTVKVYQCLTGYTNSTNETGLKLFDAPTTSGSRRTHPQAKTAWIQTSSQRRIQYCSSKYQIIIISTPRPVHTSDYCVIMSSFGLIIAPPHPLLLLSID